MIWLADRINIRRNGMTITGDDYYAMKHGPVASRTLDIINQRRLTDSQIIAYAKHFFDLEDNSVKIKKFSDDFDHLSLAERHSLEKSFFTLLKFSSEDISTKSHQFPEWVKYKEHKKHGDKRMLIDKLDFFENPSEDYFAQGEEDALLVKYNKDAFVCNPLAE